MDALPPSSPPAAFVQSAEQQAIDAYNRITDMQAWLVAQQAGMPWVPAAPGDADRPAFLLAHAAFWAVSIEDTPGTWVPRQNALARRLAAVMADLATLRHLDGTLDGRAHGLAMQATGRQAAAPGLERREATLGGVAYAGAMIVLDRDAPGVVLLFTPDRGWDQFTDVPQAERHLEARFRRLLTLRVDLPGLSRKDIERPGGTLDVASRVAPEDAFVAMAQRVVAVQREKLRQAWFEHALERADPTRTHRLRDRIAAAVQLTEAFDGDAILAGRDARLHQAVSEARRVQLPQGVDARRRNVDGVAPAWRAARHDYANRLRTMAIRQATAGNHPPAPLDEYAASQLAAMLSQVGVTDDPRTIQVTLDRSGNPASYLESIGALLDGPSALQMSLVELARANVPAAGGGVFRASGTDGSPLPLLDDATLRRMVRTLDLATRYPAYVEAAWRSGPRGAPYRQDAAALLRARMRLEAAEARAESFFQEGQAQARPGLSQRGWTWVQAVLDSPDGAQRKPLGQLDIAARQVTYKGVPIRDVVEIALQRIPPYWPAHLMSSVVYYTPGAPDGMAFREFANRDDADRLFFHHPAFSAYLLDRLPDAFAEVSTDGQQRRFKAYDRARWIFGSLLPEGYVATEAYFVSRDVQGNLFHALHDTAVEYVLTHVRESTRSTVDTDHGQLFDLLSQRALKQFVSRLATGIVTAPLHVAPAVWHAYDAVRAGDYGQAFVDATEGYVMALNAYFSGSLVLGGTKASLRTASFRIAGGALASHPVQRPGSGLASREVAKGAVKAGTADLHGWYNIDGRTYVALEGRLVPARYDKDIRAAVLTENAAGISPRLTEAALRFHDARLQSTRAGLRSNVETAQGLASAARDSDLYSEYIAQIEQHFPGAADLAHAAMYQQLVGVPAPRALASDQQSRLDSAWQAAEQALRQPMAHRAAPATHFRPVHPGAGVPDHLWVTMAAPGGAFVHQPATPAAPAWAALLGEWQGHGVVGVRLSSVAPAPQQHSSDLAVSVRVRDLIPPAGAFNLLEVVGSGGTAFVLQTLPGQVVELKDDSFTVTATPSPEG